jgi:hypothetical protein
LLLVPKLELGNEGISKMIPDFAMDDWSCRGAQSLRRRDGTAAIGSRVGLFSVLTFPGADRM